MVIVYIVTFFNIETEKGAKSTINYIAGAALSDDVDFKHESQIKDIEMLKVDYEKLRVAYLFNRNIIENDPQKMIERAVV
jgi:hypothetical protein